MTDYSEHGAIPIDDAATDDPPTVDEGLERQRTEAPDQAATSTLQSDDEPTDDSETGDDGDESPA